MRIPNRRQAIEALMAQRRSELLRGVIEAREEARKAHVSAQDKCQYVEQPYGPEFDRELENGTLMRADETSAWSTKYLKVTDAQRRNIRRLYVDYKNACDRARDEEARLDKQFDALGMRIALEQNYDIMVSLIAEVK